ncbi:glucose-6-phosphate 1-dehydrogenase [Fonticella tunisiensis]|uniref:Glucose-6-phosphate 1-dehydrogenase n=2 Tax=Fonticella tunisiensis TaxID=1096341 RepID=A0A4R7KPT8_9CLOT|nr:glucose-6-phosphate 1-dehydrogenase [Fonticella tunisiensis]
MSTNLNLSCVMVIFGGTGDLTHRKLIPALYNLKYEGILPDNFAVISVGRREKTTETYRNEIYESVKSFSRFKMDDEKWKELSERIYYHRQDFSDDDGYIRLNDFLNELDKKYNTNGNRVYYLAVAPESFETIVGKLHKHCMADNSNSWRRVVIEKPFGRDLKSAQFLNQKINEAFAEKDIYRIDHYLGKEMLQNIMVIRFANAFFEPIWNNRFIDNIQISSSEMVGVENRGGYYEKAGALRDMVQNHMLQLLTLTAMEPPVNLETESIRDEKVKVLRSLQVLTPELVKKNVVRGQYGPGKIEGRGVPGYREEERVSPDSKTETFIALKTYVENFRWSGVPFYIRTGKRMPAKSTEIVIQFKPLPEILYFKEYGIMEPNLLVIKVQPQEGIFLQFNAKRPGTSNIIVPVQMDFCQNCHAGSNSPEAYERLLYDVMRGDSTLFTRWDEVEHSWRFVDNIAQVWNDENTEISKYESGKWGPKEADELLARDNRKWWNIGEVSFKNI